MAFKQDEWPFIPGCLSEILDQETLQVIEWGCSTRFKRPLTLLDYDPRSGQFMSRIEMPDEHQRYEAFCRELRSAPQMDNSCIGSDVQQAQHSLEAYHASSDPFRCFACRLGLIDMTYIIQVQNRPLALLFCGQFLPSAGSSAIRSLLEKSPLPGSLNINALMELTEELRPMPDVEQMRQAVGREVDHIQRLAEAEYAHCKALWEREFLDNLRQYVLGPGDLDRGSLLHQLKSMLEQVSAYCRCEYAVFFGSTNEKDTILPLLAHAGLPESVQRSLPHFNWRKANLPLEHFEIGQFDIAGWLPEARSRGLRGDNLTAFANMQCAVPVLLGDRYRGVLVLGPFTAPVDLHAESRFLTEITRTIGQFALSALEVFDLEQERRAWKGAKQLLFHQFRTALTPLTSLVQGSRKAIEHRNGADLKRAVDWLHQAEELGFNLSQGAAASLDGRAIRVSRDDLEFDRYPLSVLVGNCVAGFHDVAKQHNLELIQEPMVEFLPDADVDVARLTIALANLIDNAIKYAFSDTKVYLRSHYETSSDASGGMAYIEIDDAGLGITTEELERIFQQGERGRQTGKIPGSGFGLWEADSIVKAHGGAIKTRITDTSKQRREGRAAHVVFSIEIPLRQRQLKTAGD